MAGRGGAEAAHGLLQRRIEAPDLEEHSERDRERQREDSRSDQRDESSRRMPNHVVRIVAVCGVAVRAVALRAVAMRVVAMSRRIVGPVVGAASRRSGRCAASAGSTSR